MRTIYVDYTNKCHTINDGTMTAVETDFFDGKCAAFVEGHCYELRSDGSYSVYPWQHLSELDAAQRQYEQALIADMQNALNKLGVTLGE